MLNKITEEWLPTNPSQTIVNVFLEAQLFFI
jgi:hypothetical protein